MGRVLKIDMTYGESGFIDVPPDFEGRGGRGLVPAFASDPTLEPLAPDNTLVFAPGLLAGTSCPGSGRISVGCQSPVTGWLVASNAGGMAGHHLKCMGIDAIVIEGAPDPPKGFFNMVVTKDGAKVAPTSVRNRNISKALPELRGMYGDACSYILTGIGGDQKCPMANIAVTGPDLQPSSRFGNGGAGAVLGSKLIKAIVIDPRGAPPLVPMSPEFEKAVQRFTELAKETSKAKTERGKGCMPNCAVPCMRKAPEGKGVTAEKKPKAFSFIAKTDPELADKFMDLCDDMGLGAWEIARSVQTLSPENKPPWNVLLKNIRGRNPAGLFILFQRPELFAERMGIPVSNLYNPWAEQSPEKTMEDCVMDELGLCRKACVKALKNIDGLHTAAEMISALLHKEVTAFDISENSYNTAYFEMRYRSRIPFDK
ncbi:MAG: hypothetical protein LBR22_02285 [Desulfovibrio sp.]|jgi:aldehyde:ferredoxin oxidoreductase|nr:hypothetical protein [Desulfovibrio sp.]